MVKLATICYIDNGEQFLMLHRNKQVGDIHQDKWVSVGGKFEAGETPEQCAIREIREETGLEALRSGEQDVIEMRESYNQRRRYLLSLIHI